MENPKIEELYRSLFEIQETVLQQGIAFKSLFDLMLEKKIITQEEYDEKAESVSKKVDAEIKEAIKHLEGLDVLDDSDELKGFFYGTGGDA